MISEIRTALTTVVASCFAPPIPAENITSNILARQSGGRDSSYPRVSVVSDAGAFQDLPSRQQERESRFLVVLVVRKSPTLLDTQTYVENFVEELDRKLLANYTLGGQVELVRVEGYETDSGAWAPEACVVVSVVAQAVVRR